jgi:hypothetical protein
MSCHVALVRTHVSEERITSIIRVVRPCRRFDGFGCLQKTLIVSHMDTGENGLHNKADKNVIAWL